MSQNLAAQTTRPPSIRWVVVVAAGVVAAMHVWKLPGALDGIRDDLGMSLVTAGTLLGIAQVGSMLLGLVVSLFSELIGLRRTLLIGLLLLAAGSVAGAFSTTTPFLMITRGFEGIGFLMATVVAPALIRRHSSHSTASVALGWWGAFQGIAAFIAVLASTLLLTSVSWRTWWGVMAVITAVMVPAVIAIVPKDPRTRTADAGEHGLPAAVVRIGRTLRKAPPWGIAVVFACYTLQWGAVIGFLPTIFNASGVDALVAGIATAVVAGLNGLGNVVTGILLQRGMSMRGLVLGALATMAVTSFLFFALDWSSFAGGLVWQIAIAALFSFGGAAIPASLIRLAVEVAPRDGSPAAVLGLMQHIYNAANFVGPILLATIAAAVGGWQMSWVVTVIASVIGLVLAAVLLRRSVLDSVQ